jgi:hypothetical protein
MPRLAKRWKKSSEEEDTCMSYEEEDTCMYKRKRCLARANQSTDLTTEEEDETARRRRRRRRTKPGFIRIQ